MQTGSTKDWVGRGNNRKGRPWKEEGGERCVPAVNAAVYKKNLRLILPGPDGMENLESWDVVEKIERFLLWF